MVIVIGDLPQMLSTKYFISFGKAVIEEKIFQKSTNQKQEWPVVAIFVNGSELNEQTLQRTFHRCFLTSFGSFGQAVSEKIFKNRPIRNKNCLWWPCLLMDWDKMSILYRGLFHRSFLPSFSGFQRRRLKCEKLTDDSSQVLTWPLARRVKKEEEERMDNIYTNALSQEKTNLVLKIKSL